MDDKHIPYLIVPLYYLYYMDDVAQMMRVKINVDDLRKQHDADWIRNTVESLEWAAEHPGFPFASILPNIPFSDEEVYLFLKRFLEQLKDV